MNRLDNMLERLPPAWRVDPGSLLQRFLDVVALELDRFDEDMDRVQRSHWVDTAFDRRDLEKIGALFEIPALSWEPDELYRARLKATIAARLEGAVTPGTLDEVVGRILGAADRTLGTTPVLEPRQSRRRLVEFPSVRVFSPELRARQGLLAPLEKIELVHRGLWSSHLEGAYFGVTGRRTVLPTLVNLSTGEVLTWVGRVPAGAMLRLEVEGEGSQAQLRAELDGVDVSDRLISGRGFTPGSSAALPLEADAAPRPITLERGSNLLWFVPLGLFDAPGFDQAVFSVPDPKTKQGRFSAEAGASVNFNEALFFQEPAIALDLWWREARPARFQFELAASERREAGARPLPEQDRARLLSLLRNTVDLLRAAGVDGRVLSNPLRERSPQHDRVTILRPDQGLETSEHDARLTALGALFDTTAKDGARFE